MGAAKVVCEDIAAPEERSELAALHELVTVQDLHSVAGKYDLLAKIRTRHDCDLEAVLYQLNSITGVARTTSTVVLDKVFEGQPL
ncbi:MAG: Lrp/AsnC ligand binding domain-containing protein [Giesbergeria sp.]